MTAAHRTAAYAAFARKWRPILRASLPAPCGRCGRLIEQGQRFDLGHTIDVQRYPEALTDPELIRVEHVKCNRSDGGKQGRQKQLARQRRRKGTPSW